MTKDFFRKQFTMGRKSKADERKLEILSHLYMVLKDDGIEGASIGNVAGRMGVNPSLIIHYFKSKEEMMVEMVDFLLSRYEETYLTELDKLQSSEERMDFVLDVVFGVDWLDVSDPEVMYACYYMSYHNERIRARFSHMHEWFKELLVNEIDAWIKQGVIVENEPEQIADLIIILNEGLTYLNGVWKDRERYRKRGAFLKSLVQNMLQNLKVKLYM